MTEKELLYVEDAIEHEKSIIGICNDLVSKVEEDNYKTFLNNQISNHQSLQDNLMNLLKENANEW